MSALTLSVMGVLLDIEGTTSSISFVHDVLFPYARNRADDFLYQHWEEDKVQEACAQMACDAGAGSLQEWIGGSLNTDAQVQGFVVKQVHRLIDEDSKTTGLKALQGMIWKEGFQAGELKAHVFDDVIPAIRQWKSQGIDVRIYSSGSVEAQLLFFGHLESHGDCLSCFSGHYDTTVGGKKEADSYDRIAADWGLEPNAILFVSDVSAELTAAEKAGFQTAASVRPGNPPLSVDCPSPRISSFSELHLSLRS